MHILGIETSCDDTAASVIRVENGHLETLSNALSSQIALHAKWGGVVPNLAAREHLKNILPVIEESLVNAKISPADLDLIAVTKGPGLIPALLIGTNTAKALSYDWEKPLIGIHHIEGHIFANFIHSNSKRKTPCLPAGRQNAKLITKSNFPILCLVVSGGHTQLVLMRELFDYEIVGETLDDAAGEAFDKVARILGLPYPGGPEISKKAKEYETRHAMSAKMSDLRFPRPMLHSGDFNFSFSGLKTAVLYETKKHSEEIQDEKYIQKIAFEFQEAAIEVLIAKTLLAAKKYNAKTIMLAGGVSANQELRQRLGKAAQNELPKTRYQIPDMKYSVDNAAMIAAAGYFRWEKTTDKKSLLSNWKNLQAKADLKLN